jgi:uncharacterized protein DUF4136
MERRGARAIGGWWVALAVLTPLAACVTGSGVRVRAQPAPGVNLTRYATYAWASPSLAEAAARARGPSGDIWQALPSQQASDREALDTRIRSDIDAQLTRCGYTRTRGGRPDLLVDYRVTTQEKALNDQLGEYASYRSQGGDQSLGDAFVRGYEEGTLVVLIVDAATRQRLWNGAATAVVNPALREKRIPEAMREMFAAFPVRGR